MNRDWMEKAQDILTIVQNHLLFIAAAITILDLFKAEDTKLFLWIAVLVVPFGYYFYTKKPPIIIPSIIFVVILGILSMAETIKKENDWSGYYVVIALVYVMGYFLYYFLNQYARFLKLNEKSASNIPEKEIFFNGMKMTSFFGFGSLVFLIMTAYLDWFVKLGEMIWDWVLVLLRYILGKIETSPPVEELPQAEEMQENLSGVGGAVDAPFFPEFLQDFAKTVAVIFVSLAFVLGCVIFVLVVYHFIKEYFMPQIRDMDESEMVSKEDIREYCGIEKKTQKEKRGFVFFNNKKRVRKLYYKKVLKRKRELIGEKEEIQLNYLTAKECCDKLAEQNLKMIYEKARYGSEDITAEELRLANTNGGMKK